MSKCPYCLQSHNDNKCKKEDLEKALDFYETERFYHQMKDRWSNEDFSLDDKFREYIHKIKILLDESVKMNII